jgi:hypothetical protein
LNFPQEATDTEILAKLEPVRNAWYHACLHDGCLPGTRESVLQDILLWAKNPQGQNVFWLNGLAGTGKSAIARSFSETIANDESLGASFFCSRDYINRKELKDIFPTLAHQLAYRYPHFQSHIIRILKKDPTLTHTSLISQFKNLLVNPLSAIGISCVIVIDALDECIDHQPASAILSVLGQFAKHLPLIKFFITSRPEPQIRTGFRLPLLEPLTQTFLLHKVKPSSVDSDIRLYLTQRLTTIAERGSGLRRPGLWPNDNEIKALTKKSSGLFIFASTLVSFIGSEHHKPGERLQLVLSETSGTTHEGRAGLDSLYMSIFQEAFLGDHTDNATMVRSVLSAVVLTANPLSTSSITTLIGISHAQVHTILRPFHSILVLSVDSNHPVQPLHKSFTDFITDPSRCVNTQFHIPPNHYHTELVLQSLKLMNTSLEKNMCPTPDYALNSEVEDLSERIESSIIRGSLEYACRSWYKHLITTNHRAVDVASALHCFLEQKFLFWLEVLSTLDAVDEAIHALHTTVKWLNEVCLIQQPDCLVSWC